MDRKTPQTSAAVVAAPQLPASTLAQPQWTTEAAADGHKRVCVPMAKVGLVIGRGGETIKALQYQSGAHIQVVKMSDLPPNSQERPIDITGGASAVEPAPDAAAPAAAPVAAYVPAVKSGNLIFTAGQLPVIDGKLVKEGKVGSDVTAEDAK